MADTTDSTGDTESALIYDAGERRTHDGHAAEAYDSAKRADDLLTMADAIPGDRMSLHEAETWSLTSKGYRRASEVCRQRAQWHATMAVYEAIDAGQRGIACALIDIQTEVRAAGERYE